MFRNRQEAGKLLASKLQHYRNSPAIVLAVPRGGVPVAVEVARELNLPVDVVLVKKLGHPLNKEYAIGAVGLNEVFIIPHTDVTRQYIDQEIGRIRARLYEMKKAFSRNGESESIEGKTVIVVDDGIATGLTLLGTIRVLRAKQPARLIIAAPVIAAPAVARLSKEADEVVSVLVPESFGGVGSFYRDFRQVNDSEVLQCLMDLDKMQHNT
ncbi:MAG TPA: phosphoribosyltransferase family protein [Flavisolibacter sp.]